MNERNNMKREIVKVAVAVFSVAAALSVISAQAQDDLKTEVQQAKASFLSTDPSIQKLMDESAGFAVFPNVGKGGLIVGGARGKGLLFEKGNTTGQVTMTQATIGAQAGGQSFSEMIFFQTPETLNEYKAGKFEMRADVSAVVAAQGAAKSAKFNNGVAVFTLPKKGLMVQAAVGGQKFKFEPL